MMGDEVENGVANRRGADTIVVLNGEIRREERRKTESIWWGDDEGRGSGGRRGLD